MIIGKTRLEIYNGDIVEADVDAVVNPANNMLWMGGGVSASIRKAGGESIEKEAIGKAPIEIGSATVTGAGSLKQRWVIHAVISGQDLVTDEESIRRAVQSCCVRADEINCTSIAIPLLNSISLDIEIHVAAQIIVDETVDYLLKGNTSIGRVIFVEPDETLKENIFKNTLQEKFTRHG